MMNNTDEMSWIRLFLAILIGVCLGVFITSVIISILLDWQLSGYEKLSIISNIAIVVVALATIGFTVMSIKTQKKQWLNDAFIKYEAHILLEFRKSLGKAQLSVGYIQRNLLEIKKYGYIPLDAPVLERKELIKNYNTILDLHNMYDANQHIFRKHNLQNEISCFSLFLSVVQNLPEQDLSYSKLDITDPKISCAYCVEGGGRIKSMFIHAAHFLFDRTENEEFDIEKENAFLKKDQDDELTRLLDLSQSQINSLTFKLDELTLHLDSHPTKSLSSRCWKYYPRLKS